MTTTAVDDMVLPPGATCDDCNAYRHCASLFKCKPESTRCDWSPCRFSPSMKFRMAEIAALQSQLAAITVERDALKAELEAKAKDAARYQHVRICGWTDETVMESLGISELDPTTFDAAVDVSMAKTLAAIAQEGK